jgi:hypothetical protein
MDGFDIATLVIVAAFLALIPGFISWSKGNGFIWGWLLSMLVTPIIAIPVVLFERRPMKNSGWINQMAIPTDKAREEDGRLPPAWRKY